MIDLIDKRIQQAKSNTDIQILIGESVELSKCGDHLSGCCPFHSENTPSFHVWPAKGRFKCFGCGVGGDAITWCTNYLGMTFAEALRHLTGEGPTRETAITPSGFIPEVGDFDSRLSACAKAMPPSVLIRALLEPRIPKGLRKFAWVDVQPYEGLSGIEIITEWFRLGSDTLGQYEALRLWEDMIQERWIPF